MRKLLCAALVFGASPPALPAQSPSGVWINMVAGNCMGHVPGDGTSLGEIPHPGSGRGIAVAPNGHVYSCAYDVNRLNHFDEAGTLLGSYPTDAGPYGVAIDTDRNVWVTCKNSGTLLKLDPNGAFLLSRELGIGIRGVIADWLGHIWVTRETTNEVMRLDRAGNVRVRIQVGQGPENLAVSPLGFLYVANEADCTVTQICLITDAIIRTAGFPSFPGDLAVDRDGQVWVAMETTNRILRFSHGLEEKRYFPTGLRPEGLSIDDEGNIWVACRNSRQLRKHSPGGLLLDTFSLSTEPFGAGDMTGMHALVNVDPLGDADGDGFENRAEWMAGSSLLDAGSVPATIRTERDGFSVMIEFQDVRRPLHPYLMYLTTTAQHRSSLARFSLGLDPRTLPVDFDTDLLFWQSLLQPLPGILVGFGGALDANGRGTAILNLPPLFPGLHVGALSIDTRISPLFIGSISRAADAN